MTEDPEQYSILQNWQYFESDPESGHKNKNVNIIDELRKEQISKGLSKASPTSQTTLSMYKSNFEMRQFSANPFLRQSYQRHTVYMEDKNQKKEDIKQKLLQNGQANEWVVI